MSRKKLQRPESISIYHEIRSIFDLIDTDKDNLIMINEFNAFLKQFDLVDDDDKIKIFLEKHPESLTLNDFSELYCQAMDIDLKKEI
jgi:Ca2+-binding EF-hand superfamily protein